MRPKIGKYEVLGVLGEGGMAVVYHARDNKLGREVAIKVIHQLLQEGERPRQRFLNEARVSAALTHPNIVTIYELGEDTELPYIVMEYLPGHDLQHYIRTEPVLSVAQKLEVARQVALGLEHAHSRDVIHRDIKPSNIQLLPNGVVKLLDFGIAKLASEQLTKTGQAVGTPSYMSPEQILGQTVTPASDVFSFGVVLYELYSGRLPFTGRNLQELIGGIVSAEPPDLEVADPLGPSIRALVLRCLDKSPERRPGSFTELLAELKQIRKASDEDSSVQLRLPQDTAPRPGKTRTPLEDFTQTGQLRARPKAAEAPAQAKGFGQWPTDRAGILPQPDTVRPEAISPMFVLGLALLAIIAGVVLSLVL